MLTIQEAEYELEKGAKMNWGFGKCIVFQQRKMQNE